MSSKAYSSVRARDVIVVDQEFPLPADQLPDLPPIDLEQGPQLNPPNQPLDLPVEEVNQPNQQNPQQNLPNQQQNLPAEQPNQPNQANQPNQPNQLPNPSPN